VHHGQSDTKHQHLRLQFHNQIMQYPHLIHWCMRGHPVVHKSIPHGNQRQ